MSNRKEVVGTHGYGSKHWVGDGFPVRNLFPTNGVHQTSPFLMLDYAGPQEFKPAAQPRGVGEHPHRGFETVTLAYQGAVDHRDSGGNSGTIFPGDVQWMTAASGVVHEEMHEREFTRKGGIFEMVQLWVNLPKAYKMTTPRYQSIASAEIPVVQFGEGAAARIIAGEIDGTKGPAKTFTPVTLFDLRLNAGASGELKLVDTYNAMVVLLRGDVTINGTERLDGEARMTVLTAKGSSVGLEAKTDSVLLVLGGAPIDEPVASYGPFVMNTQEELRQAIEDYRNGKMGRLSAN